ncbi:MAG: DUF3619 family protein [Burkholderiales bacterium]|nr:DUF3619 family protein [Burkholderiales bacterium]
MNEQQIAQGIREALDESASRLPYRISHRLEQARLTALAHQRTSEVRVDTRQFALAGSASSDSGRTLWWRLSVTLLPILALAAGLLVISVWNDTETADEIAEIDTAVLSDEVPLAAYTDRGFGVFLKNSRQ